MPNDDRLYDLLDAYRERLARGGDVTPADLGVDADTFTQLVKLHRRDKAITGLLSPVRMPDPRPGVNTDRYHTTQPLGSGGYGDVFRTDDRELGRAVALKVPRVLRAATEVNARLKAEAVLMGQLDHPGVPAVHSLGTDPATGRPFYTMRLIDGHTLADEIDALHLAFPPKLSAREFGDRLRPLLRRFVAVCAAVAYAHSRGVIHRDLKPLNVMLGAFDETLVMDWGLARAVNTPDAGEKAIRPEQVPAGQTLGAVGTIGYIAPEQWAADPTIDQRADVYSLGAILYHLLAGRASLLPSEIGDGFRAENVRPLAGVKAGLPPALVAVCEKAMSADRGGRYKSSTEVSADVQAWLDDRRVGAYREPWVDRAGRWTRRHRTAVSIAATAVPLLLALGVGAWLANGIVGTAETQRAAAMSQKETAEAAEAAANDRERSAARERYPEMLQTVDRLIELGDQQEAQKLLADQRTALTKQGERPGFEWGYRSGRIGSTEPYRFKEFHGDKVVALCQPDGVSDVVSVAQDGAVIRWDPDKRTVRSIHALDFGQAGTMSGFSYQPLEKGFRVSVLFPGFPITRVQPPVEVGDLLLSAGPDEQRLTPLEGKSMPEVGKLFEGIPGANVSFEFTKPNGTERRTVTVTRARTFQPFEVARPGVTALSRDGARVAIGLRKNKAGQVLGRGQVRANGAGSVPAVMVFDTSSGDAVCSLDLPGKAESLQMSGVAFSPDGTELIVGLYDASGWNLGNLPVGYALYDSRTGKRKTTLGWPDELSVTNGIAGTAFDPSGRRVYCAGCEGGTNADLSYWPTDRLRERPTVLRSAVPAENTTLTRMEVSADGRHVVLFGNGGAVLAATGAGATRRLDELRGSVEAGAFDPSGRLLAASDSEHRLHVWDVSTLTPLLTVHLPEKTDPSAIAFSADSRKVFVGQGVEVYEYTLERDRAEVRFQSLGRVGELVSAVHPSGELIVAGRAQGGDERSVRRYSPSSGQLLGELAGSRASDGNSISVAAPTSDGKKLVVALSAFLGNERPEVVVLDTRTADVLHRFPLPAELSEPDAIAWLPGERQLLVGASQAAHRAGFGVGDESHFPKRFLRYDLDTKRSELLALTAAGVQGMALTPDGKQLVLLDRHSVFVRDATTLRLNYRIPLADAPGNTLTVSDDGRRCAVASGVETSHFNTPDADSQVMVFDLTDGKVTVPRVELKDGLVSSLTFTPDGSAVVCGTSRGNVKVVSAADGSIGRTISVVNKSGRAVTGVFVPAGGTEVVASAGQLGLQPNQLPALREAARLTRYSLGTGKKVADVPGDVLLPFICGGSADRSRAVVFDPYAGTARLFDPSNWDAPLSTYVRPRPPAGSDITLPDVATLAASPDGKRVAVASSTGEVAVLSCPDGQLVRSWKAKAVNCRVVAVRFSPDSAGLYVAGAVGKAKEGGTGRVVRLDVQSGETREVLTTPRLCTYADGDIFDKDLLLLSTDGTRFIVALEGTDPQDGEGVAVYSLASSEEVARRQLPPGSQVQSMGYDPASETVVATTQSRVVEQTSDGKGRWASELHVWAVGASELRTLEIDTTRTGVIGRVAAPNTALLRPAISPGGRLVAFRNFRTGTVKVCEVSSGRSVLTISASEGFGPLLFTPDGLTLLNMPNGRSSRGYCAARAD